MPAAAVIPALIAYINVVAVKKLVVGSWNWAESVCQPVVLVRSFSPTGVLPVLFVGCRSVSLRGDAAPWRASCASQRGSSSFTVSKLECLKQPLGALNTLAWDNGIGLWFYFVGF